MTRKNYSQEFKAEAVRMITSGERKQSEVSRNLGISSSTISNWVAHAAGGVTNSSVSSESAELKKLRAEIKQLKLEQEILKKAATYFAKNLL